MVLFEVLEFGILKRRPFYFAFLSIFFVLLGFLFAYFVFPAEFSIAMISFSSLLILPYVVKMVESERMKKTGKKSIFNLLNIFNRHDKIILVFIFMFFGMALEYTLLFSFLNPVIGNVAFEKQINLVFTPPAGLFAGMNFFWQIVTNNLGIVIICFALSLFYGSGAIFILNYNASIVGMLYGSSIRTMVWGSSYPSFMNPWLYLPHTILEILAYLLAAVAGSILLRAMVLGKDSHKPFSIDATVILILAIILIFAAGFVEVTVPFMG